MENKSTCCELKNMCGLPLWQGVIVVAITTIVVCGVIVILSSTAIWRTTLSKGPYNKDPILAINMLLVLVSLCIATYQIVISALLLWGVSRRTEGSIYYCSLWYVSHLSILVLYCFLFTARTIITVIARKYLAACFTLIGGCAYKAIFIYFAVVVNSYLHSVDVARYV